MAILDNAAVRESVWLYAWGQAMKKSLATGNSYCSSMDASKATQDADECLSDFDSRFPDHKQRAQA
jgi:hypothetical protein